VIVFSFALPQESKGIVRRMKVASRTPGPLPVISGRLSGREVVILHTGMGMASASERVGAFLEKHTPDAWIAAGFGGALSAQLNIGDIVVAENFSDPGLLEAAEPITSLKGALVTVKEVMETAGKKKDLGRHTGAIVVDMETAGIHRLCTARGIPLLAVRAISDTACQDLPVPAAVWFNVRKQRPRPVKLVFYLLTHPGRILPFAEFVRGVNKAGSALTQWLCKLELGQKS
jgi:adenosylhomocysteine nucleosidase